MGWRVLLVWSSPQPLLSHPVFPRVPSLGHGYLGCMCHRLTRCASDAISSICWRSDACGLTAYTPGSAPDSVLVNEYGNPLPVFYPDDFFTMLQTLFLVEYGRQNCFWRGGFISDIKQMYTNLAIRSRTLPDEENWFDFVVNRFFMTLFQSK